MTLYVYKITHKDSGRAYIGLTDDAGKRWRRHIIAARSPRGTKIARAIQEHGIEQFDFEVIEAVSDLELAAEREIYWITKNRATETGVYNVRRGGDVVSVEQRAKIRVALRKRLESPEARAQMRKAHLGKRHSAESIAKMRAAKLGKPLSAEHRAKLSASHLGRKHSAEHRAKIGAAHKGRPKPAETRAKLRAASLGKKHSAETRAKISAAHRGRP